MPLVIHTRIQPTGPAAAILLTEEQVDSFGAGRRPPVRVTIGDRSARLRVAKMGPDFCIGLSKAVRAELGVELNDEVTATIELDTAERTVEIPAALTEALAADPVARERFEALAFTHRKEYAVWIAEAKKEETRARRVTQALEMLREGKTRS